MIEILRKYAKVHMSEKYCILNLKNILVIFLIGILFYNQGASGDINQSNTVIISCFSFLMIMFSCHCINNELFIKINTETLTNKIYKKIIASNIVCLAIIVPYILLFIIVNVYFFDYTKNLQLLLHILTIIIVSTSIGNFIFINNKDTVFLNITPNTGNKKHLAIVQLIKQSLISIFLTAFLTYIYYKYDYIILLPFGFVLYILSLIINNKFHKFNLP